MVREGPCCAQSESEDRQAPQEPDFLGRDGITAGGEKLDLIAAVIIIMLTFGQRTGRGRE